MRKSRKNNNHRFRRLKEQLLAETYLKITVIYTISGKVIAVFAVNVRGPNVIYFDQSQENDYLL